jgi:hypothetical protein
MASYPFSLTARRRFAFQGVRLSDLPVARQLAARLNAARDLEREPERAVFAGVLLSANLLDEIFAHLLAQYRETVAPRVWSGAVEYLQSKLGAAEWQTLLDALRDEFGAPATLPEVLEYLVRLRLCNANEALANLRELNDDGVLPQPVYSATIADLHSYFETLPKSGPDEQNLIDFLFAPLRACPDSLEAQLRFVHERWSNLVAPFSKRLLFALDVLAEENKPVFHGPGPAQVHDYKRAVGMDEYEAFSPDKDWMPRVVLLAKNTYVWLDQLSKKYQTHIYRLDLGPDEELDEMAARGFTGL